MPRLIMFVRRLQKPLILVLLWAFSIPLCPSRTAGRVENVQPGNVLALVSGVLQTHYHGLQKRDDGTYHITTDQGDGNGLLDSGWNLLVPPLFENIGLFPIGDADGLAWAVYREKGGKSYQGFIDRHGNFVLLQEQSKF